MHYAWYVSFHCGWAHTGVQDLMLAHRCLVEYHTPEQICFTTWYSSSQLRAFVWSCRYQCTFTYFVDELLVAQFVLAQPHKSAFNVGACYDLQVNTVPGLRASTGHKTSVFNLVPWFRQLVLLWNSLQRMSDAKVQLLSSGLWRALSAAVTGRYWKSVSTCQHMRVLPTNKWLCIIHPHAWWIFVTPRRSCLSLSYVRSRKMNLTYFHSWHVTSWAHTICPQRPARQKCAQCLCTFVVISRPRGEMLDPLLLRCSRTFCPAWSAQPYAAVPSLPVIRFISW